jgi:integrase/recombinase XerC
MKDIIYEFLDYITYEKKYSDYTETNYEEDLFKYNEYLQINNLNYLNVDYSKLSDFVIYLKKSGYKSTTINRILSALRSFYNYLEKTKKITSNPFSLISSLKTEKRLPNYFKYDEFLKMLDTLDLTKPLDVRNRLILEMLLATGCRVSELVNIKINDIDFNNHEIKILGKGNKERIVFFGSYCLASLNAYLKTARITLLDSKTSEYLFINNNGGVLTDRGVRLIIDNIIKKSCITSKVSPHTFRHTFATIMLNEGCDIKSVQELLGHSSLSTTSIYTHLTNEQIRTVYLKTHPRAKK